MSAYSRQLLCHLQERRELLGYHIFKGTSLFRTAIALVLLIEFTLPIARSETNLSQSNAETPTQATQSVQGEKAFSDAELLRARWEQAALRQAIEKYDEAAASWRNDSPSNAAEALRRAGDIYFILSEYKQALAYYYRSLGISRMANARVEELETLNSIGYAHIYLSENKKALTFAMIVMKECKRLPSSVGEVTKLRLQAQATNNKGEIDYALGDLNGSLKMFTRALELWTAANDRHGSALAHLNLGYSYTDIGDLQRAAEHYHQSLALWQQNNDRRGEALSRTALGAVYSFFGDKQLAIDSHLEALALFRQIGNHQGEAASINGIAQAYEDLSDYQKALENYQQALDLYQMIGNRDFVALNKYYIGRVYFSMSQAGQARAFYLQALTMSRELRDRQIEAHILKGLGIIEHSEGNFKGALKQFRDVLTLYDRVGDRKGKAYTLNSIGHVYLVTGAPQRALEYFQRALPLIRATEDKLGEAMTLYNIASVERDRGNVAAALSHVRESIGIIEASRAKVDSKDLRTSFFAQAHKHYELCIDLLMRLYKRQPASDYGVQAFYVSERARARSLLDMLTEERFDIGKGANNSLLAREQELVQLLDTKKEYKSRLLSSNQMSTEAIQVAEEIRTLSREYETVRARIREQLPRYAALTQPNQLSVQDIQAALREDGTLLLEFSLGEERSYLWSVGSDSVSAYELPGRAVIERAAERVYELLAMQQPVPEEETAEQRKFVRVSDSDYLREASALSSTLLGPVASQLESKRLLIVTDGRLQYIPFEALPLPIQPGGAEGRQTNDGQVRASEPQLLIDTHEIVELPSASILAAIRLEEAHTEPDVKTVAVLADPVFDKDDPRVQQAQSLAINPQPARRMDDVYLHRALRTLNGNDETSPIPRLPASLKEAKAIMSVTPRDKGTMAVGFDASRDRMMSEDLKNYRIIHLATHGVLDSEQPEMSGLIFSMVDRNGNLQDGYLRLHDIYGLDVRADLVVLSACRTGLGQNVQGEGLIGLTRGFMYAGSKSVVASLWKVDDEATAELMREFYAYMLRDGRPPAAALRAAQQSVRSKKRWRSPYFWAGFVLHGEYKETFVAVRNEAPSSWVLPLLVTGILAIGLFLLLKRRKS